MSEPAITSLPWVVTHSRLHGYVRAAATDPYGNQEPVCCAGHADADFIVRACNSHPALVAALEAFLQARGSGSDAYTMDEVESMARRALAQAQEVSRVL